MHTIRSLNLTCFLLLAMSLILTVQAMPRLSPLETAIVDDLNGIAADPIPESLVNNIHYVVSDEKAHHLFRPFIADRGGVFIGIGTNQNYSMAPFSKPEILVLLDFDQMVIDTHRLYRVAFLNAKTPDEFLQLWAEPRRFKKMVKAEYSTDRRMLRGILNAFVYSRPLVVKTLTRQREIAETENAPTFLNDQTAYDYLVTLFKTNRVFLIRGDLRKKGAMIALGKVLRRHDLKVGVYHPSNAEQYFPLSTQYRANVLGLPTDEKTMVVRTRAWPTYQDLNAGQIQWLQKRFQDGKLKKHLFYCGKPRPQKCNFNKTPPAQADTPQKKVINYTYATQSFENFKGWLADPKIRRARQMLPKASRQFDNQHYAIEPRVAD